MQRKSKKDGDIYIPRHIGIIMDGNGRWAKKRGLPRTAGHFRGAEVFQQVVRHCEKIGVEAITVYAFSSENWSRPYEEVNSIMNLLRKYLDDAFGFKDENIRIVFIGDRHRLDEDIVELIERIESASKDNDGLILNVAINYGGREEILAATAEVAKLVRDGVVTIDGVDEALLNSLMYTSDSPPLDMVLRPGGELRISNFMLWQCAYSEFIFMDTLWPDFSEKELDRAIEIFNMRGRRFGGVAE